VSSEETAILAVIEMTLIFAPPLMLVTFFFIKAKFAHHKLSIIAGAAITLCVISLFSGLLDLSFNDIFVNFLVIALAYTNYCLLAASGFLIRRSGLRAAAIILTFIPIGFGYLLATIGFLEMIFVVDDATRPPESIQTMAPGLTCVVSDWGMAGNEGVDIDLYRRWASIGFIKRDVQHIIVDFDDRTNPPQTITCAQALSKYEAKPVF